MIILLATITSAFVLGYFIRWLVAEGKVASAKKRAAEIISEAEKEAELKRQSLLLEAKNQFIESKTRLEREITHRKKKLDALEKRLSEREFELTRKIESLERREKECHKREKELLFQKQKLEEKERQLAQLIEEEKQKLAQIANVEPEQAKKMLLSLMESEIRADAAVLIRNIINEARETAEQKAKEIIALAMQKCALDHNTEILVSVVNLPNEEIKGRIIGREGRNIRAFESATGCNIIVDDTPEAVVISGFDPIRREIARISLERLIRDGRIHPARIEETVEKVKKELNESILETAKETAFELGIHDLHPELLSLLGRLKYRTSYGQNVLQHSKEVAYLAGAIASELGLDSQLCRRAGLLHDIGKAVSHEMEGPHANISATLAKKYGERQEIVDALAGHHGEVENQTIEAVIIQVADAISGARPGARRETLESYIKRLEKLEEIAKSFAGVANSYAISAGRELRVFVKPDHIDDAGAAKLAYDISKKIEQEIQYPGQIKVTVIRETRVIEYAK